MTLLKVALAALIASSSVQSPAGLALACTPPPETDPLAIERLLPDLAEIQRGCKRFGTPIVRFRVTPTGRTEKHEFLRRTGCPRADKEIISWLRKWSYIPATRKGKQIAKTITVVVNWNPGGTPDEHGHPSGQLSQISSDPTDGEAGRRPAAGSVPRTEAFDPSNAERVLRLSLEHTEQARLSIAKERATASTEPVRKLAELLLDEWKLLPSDERLKAPALVWRPKLDLNDLPPEARHINSPSVLVTGEVTSEGTFDRPKVLTSSGNTVLDDLCLGAASKALYRPARFRQEYIATKAVIQFHFDPR